jgi:hypothetical protein
LLSVRKQTATRQEQQQVGFLRNIKASNAFVAMAEHRLFQKGAIPNVFVWR